MYFEANQNTNSPIICNIPHGSTKIPLEFLEDYVLSPLDLKQEVLNMADLFTEELYEELRFVSSYIQSNISRVVVDIERFPDEKDESMSLVGMSAFYTRTSKGQELRNLSIEKKELLKKIYDEYHENFTSLVGGTLSSHGRAIIVDCHSFPSIPRAYEPDQGENRPDICLGTDEYHTPPRLVELLQGNFEKAGYSVKINSPFAGTIVPLTYYKKDSRVVSVMIEVNRRLYMDEKTHMKLKTFSATSKLISGCIIQSVN